MFWRLAGRKLGQKGGSLYTEVFTHRSFYTEKSLHREAFTPRSVYTEKPLHRGALTQKGVYTQKLLHADAFTHRSFYTQRALTHICVYRQKQARLQTETFTQISLYRESFYTGKSHTEVFTQRSLYTEKLVHPEAFTPRSFKQRSLHRGVFTWGGKVKLAAIL